jgi:hypothetical protein
VSARPPPAPLVRVLSPYLADFHQMLRRGAARYQAAERGASLEVRSWWRDRAHNAAEGGAPLSQHLLGLAVDVRPVKAGADARELARLAGAIARAFHGAGLGMTAINEWATARPHVHIQKSPAGVWDATIREAAKRGLLDVSSVGV